MSVTLGGLTAEAAQHVHEHVSAATAKGGGVYKPKLFNPHEYETVKRLASLIIPADEVSASAVEAGAPQFIDLIAGNNEEMSTLLLGGLQWLDGEMKKQAGTTFLDAQPDQQLSFLEQIAYREKTNPELLPGVRFLSWMRRLTADAFYTSPIGIKDVGYMGNKGMTVFQVPKEAIAYAVKRSGL